MARLGADLGLRAAGGLAIACAWLAAHALSSPATAVNGASALDYLLALIAFLSGTTGAALLLAGGHLLDPVELGPRWRRFGR